MQAWHHSLLMTNLLESQDRQVSPNVPTCAKPLFYHILLTFGLVKYLLQHGSIATGLHFTLHNEKSLREIFIVFYGWRAIHLSLFAKYHYKVLNAVKFKKNRKEV